MNGCNINQLMFKPPSGDRKLLLRVNKMCLWNIMPPLATRGHKVQQKLLLLNINITAKVTMSSTLVSFERASLVEYANQIWSEDEIDRRTGKTQYHTSHH